MNTNILQTPPRLLLKRLLRAREAILSPIRMMAAKSGLTEQQWRILDTLSQFGSLDATHLAEECSLLLPSQTRILQALVNKQLIVTRRDPIDRRRLLVELSDEGKLLVLSCRKEYDEVSSQIKSALEEPEMSRLLELLEKLERI